MLFLDEIDALQDGALLSVLRQLRSGYARRPGAFPGALALISLRDVRDYYLEPLAALQDDDLAFPNHIELAYYAIYNLYRSAVEGAAVDDWLIVNQALSAEEDSVLWPLLLADALQAARR